MMIIIIILILSLGKLDKLQLRGYMLEWIT